MSPRVIFFSNHTFFRSTLLKRPLHRPRKQSHLLLTFSHLAKRSKSKATCFDGSFTPVYHATRRSPLITNKPIKVPAKPTVVTRYIPVAQTCN
ncbi:hypothetical protein Hanom_Chr00s175590g01830331 [Helianthus anomalus]